MYAEININELKSKLADYRLACFDVIKDLLDFPGRSVTFNTENIEECPYCIGDDYMGIIDGIIRKIYLDDDNNIRIEYHATDDVNRIQDEDIRYINHIDLIDVCDRLCNKINNG